MDALALYLWHILCSRDESDSEEVEVEVPRVKLPEITVLRKNDDGTRKKCKRVSFAEPLHRNGSVPNNDPPKSSCEPEHYTLVPVDNDHDYTCPPLVCFRRLPDGSEIKTSIKVKKDECRQASENERESLENSDKDYNERMHEPELGAPMLRAVRPMLPEGPVNKSYKAVHNWNELLEQFDTKPEEGDMLFRELIRALGDEDEGFCDIERGLDEDDVCLLDANLRNGSGDHDEDTASVEIIWESSNHPEASTSHSILKELSCPVPSKSVFEELFDESAEKNVALVEASGGETNKLRDSKKGVIDSKASVFKQTADADVEVIEDDCIVVIGEQGDSGEIPYKKQERRVQDSCSGTQRKREYEKIEHDCDHSDCSSIQPDHQFGRMGDENLEGPLESISNAQPKKRRKSKAFDENVEATETKMLQPEVKKKRIYKPRDPSTLPPPSQSKHALIARLARQLRLTQDPRDIMDDDKFKNEFGFSKEFVNYLVNLLTPILPVPLKVSTSVPAYLKVLATLNFLVRGAKHSQVGQLTHMSQPQISKSLAEVIGTLISSAPEPALPTSDPEFVELYGLPEIIGAVDATHIPIKPPDGIGRKCPNKDRFEHPSSYKNSANYYSINVEIVSSSSNRVLFCSTKQPGSFTKPMLWQQSKVRELIIARRNEDPSAKLIAGSGYYCEPWLLTPVPTAFCDPGESQYNASMAGGLQDSVRLTIGLLKGRFKAIGTASVQHALYYSPEKAGQVFSACCILHNMAMDFGEEMPVPTYDEFDLTETRDDSQDTNWDGIETRNKYILEHFC